jgi:hydrogenase maturation protein HypF
LLAKKTLMEAEQPPDILKNIDRLIIISELFGLKRKIPPTLACGGDLKNVFSLAANNTIHSSPPVGNLEDADIFRSFKKSIEQYKKELGIEPEIAVVDKHPGYFSSRYGRELGLPVVEVQHHHAHIASVMAEYALEGDVVGLALDGAGYGDDGTIWGGEILLASYSSFSRRGYFKPMRLPGGDAAAREPWRVAVGVLLGLFGEDIPHPEFVKNIGERRIRHIVSMIAADINCPLSSGAGRLFDAAASILNVCHENTFEGQAPIKLEEIADRSERGLFDYGIGENGEIDFEPMMRQITEHAAGKKNVGATSAMFHNTIAAALADSCRKLRKESNKVCLSGGVFQNKFLLKRLVPLLEKAGLKVFLPKKIPVNDGGLSIGQIAVSAHNANLT